MQDEETKAVELEAQVDTVLASIEAGVQKLAEVSSALETLNRDVDLWEQEAEAIDVAVEKLGDEVGKDLTETISAIEKEIDALPEVE